MDVNIKNEWSEMIFDDELNIDAKWIYTLLNPTDRDEFFKIVNIIVERHKIRDDEEERRGNQAWTKEYEMQFKKSAVNYLIEFEKNNQAYIPTPSTSPITYPINIPYVPSYPSTNDPMPWQMPVIYCKSPDKVFYCTTT